MRLVYYEPPRAAQPRETLADRVRVAYEQAWRDLLGPDAAGLPTSSHIKVVHATAVTAIGVYHPDEGVIAVNPGAGARVAAWLQLTASDIVNGGLARHLQSTAARNGGPSATARRAAARR